MSEITSYYNDQFGYQFINKKSYNWSLSSCFYCELIFKLNSSLILATKNLANKIIGL